MDQTTLPNHGGLAPEDRQCRYTLASGYHCRRWSIRGHDYCHQHSRWMDCRIEGPIEVPLMEDPSAVQLVATQTVRAMGWGQIPPANGRAILHGCRIVQTGFALELAEAKFRLKCHQLGLSPEQFLRAGSRCKPVAGLTEIQPDPVAAANQDDELQPTLSATVDLDASIGPPNPLDDVPPPPRPKSACDPCIAALRQGADESLLDCKHCPAAIAGNLRAPQFPDPCNPPDASRESELESRPLKRPAFPHLKTNWDDALARFEGQCAGPRYPRRYPLQTDQEYAEQLAAIRARPFDDMLHPRRTSPPPPLIHPPSSPTI